MGQQCCQTALDDESIALKALMIKQTEYQKIDKYEQNDPFINQRIQNLEQQEVFKHRQLNKYFFGHWDVGYATGKGSMYVPGTIFYQGQFSQGVPDQQGKIQYLSREELYQGQFLNGKACGKGNYKNLKKKIQFQGIWLNSFPQNGTLTLEDNPTIQLIRFEDYKQGQAVIQYNDGRQYKGRVSTENFIPQGKGRITFKDKSFYDGEWHNGLMHGEGVYQWPDGSKYTGNYINGKKQGYGVFKYSSGKKYQGNWTNGKQQGYGKIIKGQNKEQKVGIWKQGKFQKAYQTNEQHNKISKKEDHQQNNQRVQPKSAQHVQAKQGDKHYQQ